MPCDQCGTSLERHERDGHVCDPDRRLDYQIFQQRTEIAQFDDQLGAYLDSPHGQFELWYAQHTRAHRKH